MENPLIQFRTMRAYECQKKTHLDSLLVSYQIGTEFVVCYVSSFNNFLTWMDINIMAQLVNCSCSLHGFCLPTGFLRHLHRNFNSRFVSCIGVHGYIVKKAWRIVACKKKMYTKDREKGLFCSISICI